MSQGPSQAYLYLSISIVTFLHQSTFLSYWGSTWSFCIVFVLLNSFPCFPILGHLQLLFPLCWMLLSCFLPALAPSHVVDLPLLTAFSGQRVFWFPDLKATFSLLTPHHPLFHCSVTSFMELIKFVIILFCLLPCQWLFLPLEYQHHKGRDLLCFTGISWTGNTGRDTQGKEGHFLRLCSQ